MSITIMLRRLWERVVREFLKFQKHHFKNLKITQDLLRPKRFGHFHRRYVHDDKDEQTIVS
jgi:hypothetical protein